MRNAGVSDIYLFTYILAVRLPLLKQLDGRTGRSLQPGLNNLLTLNLIVCRKSQLNLKRISLLKRKAQHRRKRLQRKKHARFKTQRARFTAPGFFLPCHLWFSSCGCRCCVLSPTTEAWAMKNDKPCVFSK